MNFRVVDLRPEMAWANDETARWTFFCGMLSIRCLTVYDSVLPWAIGQAHLGCMRRQPAQS